MMKFLVKQQKIEALEREVIASDQIAFVSVKFVFDGTWKTLHKVVQFTQCEETYNLVLGIEGTTCLLPAELHPGAVKMSLFGYDAESDTTLRATTVPVTLHIRPSGFHLIPHIIFRIIFQIAVYTLDLFQIIVVGMFSGGHPVDRFGDGVPLSDRSFICDGC